MPFWKRGPKPSKDVRPVDICGVCGMPLRHPDHDPTQHELEYSPTGENDIVMTLAGKNYLEAIKPVYENLPPQGPQRSILQRTTRRYEILLWLSRHGYRSNPNPQWSKGDREAELYEDAMDWLEDEGYITNGRLK